MNDVHSDIEEDVGGLFIRSQQAITDDYLTRLREAKDASLEPMREMNRVCSVPVAVVERWLSEGFNIYQASAREIIKRLNAEHLDAFITTRRRV